MNPSETEPFRSSEGNGAPPPPADNSGDDSGNDVGDNAGERLANAGREAAARAKRQADGALHGAARTAAAAAGETSAALDGVAERLADSGQENLSRAANALSDRISRFSTYLEGCTLENLASDARKLAQRNPALFVAGGVALGFVLTRFFKASGGNGRDHVDGA